jgi:hypothetical protein
MVVHLCHLLLEASGTLTQQAAILNLLTGLTSARDSTACMDLFDESAVPRLVLMLAQPGIALTRKPAGEPAGYVNSVPQGEAPPMPNLEEMVVQEAAAALLAAACKKHPQNLEQVCNCILIASITVLLKE